MSVPTSLDAAMDPASIAFVTTPFAIVVTFDPLVVTFPLNSAAVMAVPLPRTRPVRVLPVPVPPFAIGTIENVAVGHAPAPPPRTKSPDGKSVPADSTVVDVKHGTAPDTPPVTVTGNAGAVTDPFAAAVTEPSAATVILAFV
jgi:hypothetical protein